MVTKNAMQLYVFQMNPSTGSNILQYSIKLPIKLNFCVFAFILPTSARTLVTERQTNRLTFTVHNSGWMSALVKKSQKHDYTLLKSSSCHYRRAMEQAITSTPRLRQPSLYYLLLLETPNCYRPHPVRFRFEACHNALCNLAEKF